MALNSEVTAFLDVQNHPLREEIEVLREIILSSNKELSENVKWNGPNYSLGKEDRITMKIHPPKFIQLIFHRGAKVLAQPAQKLIQEENNLLIWKSNDRAVATFKSNLEINSRKMELIQIVQDWIEAAKVGFD